MTERTLFIEGMAFWAPTLPSWPQARAAFRGEGAALTSERIPSPTALACAERRRAPETVALALAVSEAAAQAAGRNAGELLAVFTSAHGDLPVIDHLCSTLVHTPRQVSPTRFLHSIHNAPAGLWSQLNRNGLNHTAVSAAECSFAAGLLEAAVLAETEQRSVLLVGYDTAAVGALTHTTRSQGALAMALVLHPQASPRSRAALHWQLCSGVEAQRPPQSAAALALPPNGMSQALPFFEALARETESSCTLALSPHQFLHTRLQALPST